MPPRAIARVWSSPPSERAPGGHAEGPQGRGEALGAEGRGGREGQGIEGCARGELRGGPRL
eukprot:572435-Alexandrium_andersonii.AAC.1